MSAFESFTPAMYDALRAIGGGAVTAKDIGIHGNTLSALCDRGFLRAEHASCRTYYEPTQLGLGAIAMLKAPFVPKRIDGPVATIQKAVAEYYGINPVEMVSDRRARSVARPRQIAMYLARELTTYSYPMIGKLFGNRDHTTVLHAVRLIAHLDEHDAEISHDINVLLSELEDLRS